MLSKKWLWIIGGVIVVLICAECRLQVADDVRVARATYPGAPLSWESMAKYAFTYLGGITGILAIIKGWREKVTESLPSGPTKKIVVALLGTGQQEILADIYAKSTNAAVRKSVREAAFADDQDIFNGNFPIDPVIDGPSTTVPVLK